MRHLLQIDWEDIHCCIRRLSAMDKAGRRTIATADCKVEVRSETPPAAGSTEEYAETARCRRLPAWPGVMHRAGGVNHHRRDRWAGRFTLRSASHFARREGPMAGELVRNPAKELTAKAVMWGPPLLGAALLGPVGVVLGLATSVAIAVKISSGSDSDRKSD